MDAEIVWGFGPFPAGSFPDDTTFLKLDSMLLENELFIGDGVYSSPKNSMTQD